MSSSLDTSGRQNALLDVVTRRFEQSMTVPDRFFTEQAERIAQACWAMARCFHRDGRLFAFGAGAAATDAQHVSVEFVHPVIVGKRALPAIALPNDSATVSGLMTSEQGNTVFARQLRLLARPQDSVLGFLTATHEPVCMDALRVARQLGLLTLVLASVSQRELVAHIEQESREQDTEVFCFVVPSSDAITVQETHETLYHILWELVHIFFEHEGILS